MRGGLGLEIALLAAGAALLLLGRTPSSGGTPFELHPREPDELRVVTWNVGGALTGEHHALAADAIVHVADVLHALDPDIACLQELASARQVIQLQQTLGDGWSSIVGPQVGRGRVAIFARRGELMDFRPPRDVGRAAGAVYHSPGRPNVLVLSLHADAFSAGARNGEIGAATDALRSLAFGNACILAGDLNLDLDLDKRGDLFTDDRYLDVETYNYATALLLDATRGTGATAEPDRRLDYVLAEPDDFAVRSAGPWRDRRIDDMDHDPVVADLVPRR